MESLLFGLNAILPMFAVALLGYLMRSRGFMSEKGFSELNRFCFSIILPVMLFKSTYTSDFRAAFNAKMLFYGVIVIMGYTLLLWAVCSRIIADKKIRGSFIQATFRSNYVIMGTALMSAYSPAGVGTAALMLAVIIPIYTALATMVLTACGSEFKLDLLTIAKKTLKTPIIIGILLGIACNLCRLPMPEFAATSVNYIASMGTPVALLTAGAKIKVRKCLNRYSLSSAFVKLIAEPLVFVPPAVLLGLRNEALLVLFILFSSPTAITTYSLASNMGCDETTAADCVFVSTIFSVFTFTVGIALLRQLGLI